MSIWDFREIKKNTDFSSHLSLGEGNTPLERFEDEENKLFLKREDLNPTGSWKDRGTALKVSSLVSRDIKKVVIPSSGNAAISLLKYLENTEIKAYIVVSPEISEVKKQIIEELAKNRHEVIFDKQAKKRVSQISHEQNAELLRSSMDSEITKGYWSLGMELEDTILHNQKEDTYILAAVSSGTAFVGMAEGLFMKLENEYKMPKFIAVQTESCMPVVNEFVGKDQISKTDESDPSLGNNSEKSLADAIVDKSVLRMPQILKVINNTGGSAMSITNKELVKAKDFMDQLQKKTIGNRQLTITKSSNVERPTSNSLSYTSLLPIAAYLKLKSDGKTGNFICIISGR